jgi:hypothetical protein
VGTSSVNLVANSKLRIFSANAHALLCIVMRTGRLWALVWPSSRVHLTRAFARESGECYDLHGVQDFPTEAHIYKDTYEDS